MGIGVGIYLAEYAPRNRFTELVRTCIEGLASVPSIVIGLFGYILFVEYFDVGLTVLGASLSLAILNLPILTRVNEEAISMVPQELREASLALGATKAQTIVRVVLPSALSKKSRLFLKKESVYVFLLLQVGLSVKGSLSKGK
jgi:phosphate transport system permease protein